MKVVKILPGEEPEAVEITGTLESMQAVVGGFVEHVSLTQTLDIWVNEEGLLLQLPYNRTLATPFGEIPLFGTILVTSHDEQGETIGLTDGQVNFVLQLFKRDPEINVPERGIA